MKNGYLFFLRHAGYSYDPATETPLRGRQRCAKRLADAERAAGDAGVTYEWEPDVHFDSSDFSDDPDPWPLWSCIARDAEGKIFATLGGIDFGRDGQPWGAYRRVVEAELASERF